METLVISMNDMTGSGVRHLAGLSLLRSLDITKVKDLTVEDIAPVLMNLPNMVTLSLCMQDQIND